MEGGEALKEDKLPPGFRFHPTDEELITYYLINKISDANFTARAVGDVDLNKCEPWELPGKAKMGEKEWYFFNLRDRKYPTGVRTNRATNSGYWKTTGKDKEIYYNNNTSELVGMKKTLVFYKGRAPRGEKSDWVMHEYRIHSKSAYRTTKQDEWVVCRVFKKIAGGKKNPTTYSSSSRAAVVNHHPYNTSYNLENSMQPQIMMMQQDQNNYQLLHGGGGRNYYNNMTPREFNKVLYNRIHQQGGPSTTQQVNLLPVNNMPPPLNSFTISGLNVNLNGTSSRPPLQPGMDVSALSSNGAAIAVHDHQSVGYGGDSNHSNNGFMNMEQCAEMDPYWPY